VSQPVKSVQGSPSESDKISPSVRVNLSVSQSQPIYLSVSPPQNVLCKNIQCYAIINLFFLFLDNETLLASEEFCYIDADVQGNVVLPCRPTSPDIKITLSKSGSSVSTN
jgi:hypothetical protein